MTAALSRLFGEGYGLCARVVVLGGRVTPAFARNALQRAGRDTGALRIASVAVFVLSLLPVFWGQKANATSGGSPCPPAAAS